MAESLVRCAIYTRKSSEEGLEQSFNSLAAQREACTAFIESQKHEGWRVLPTHYDDGGFSGGSMERPALQQLLGDIRDRKLEAVVIYKVDRLTRSLTDFAKIIEVFDAHKVSFISVTQQFNTATSMGRLTLNVLLSFAQFERELTGERIRDKIAASKRKGMWMGGMVPLGYDCMDRKLVINEVEAVQVRRIFEQYIRLGCITKLKEFLDQDQVRSKARVNRKGKSYGGNRYSRGALSYLLNNRIYIGEITHRNHNYPGQHAALIDKALWNRVQELLNQNNQANRQPGVASTSNWLKGKLFDSNGVRYTPTNTLKKGRLYRYYTSQALLSAGLQKPSVGRIPASYLEDLTAKAIELSFKSPTQYVEHKELGPEREAQENRIKELGSQVAGPGRETFLRLVISRVVVGAADLWIDIDLRYILEKTEPHNTPLIGDVTSRARLKIDITRFRRDNSTELLFPEQKANLDARSTATTLKMIARAYEWYERIVSGEIRSMEELATAANVSGTYVRQVLQYINVSPRLVDRLLSGSGNRFPSGCLALPWEEQEKI